MFPLAAHPFRSAADWENLRVPVPPYGETPDVLMPVPCQTDWSLAPLNLKGPDWYPDLILIDLITNFDQIGH